MSSSPSTFSLHRQLTRKFAKFCAILLTTTSMLAGDQESSVIEIRGLLKVDDHLRFSIRDNETGRSWWADFDTLRYGVRLLDYDISTQRVRFEWRGKEYVQGLAEADGASLGILISQTELSSYNKTLLEKSSLLIRETTSPKTGRSVRDQREVERLQTFLRTNPGVAEVHDTLPLEFGDSLDYDVFLKLDAPSIMKSRNRQNTARWGVRKDVDENAVVEALRKNPSGAELDSLIARQTSDSIQSK